MRRSLLSLSGFPVLHHAFLRVGFWRGCLAFLKPRDQSQSFRASHGIYLGAVLFRVFGV